MKNATLAWCFLLMLGLLACQEDEVDTRPQYDQAEALYGIWNRLEVGFMDCENPELNNKEFAEGSVGFERGGFYTTYANNGGKGKINTVRFEATNKHITFLSRESIWAYGIVEKELFLKKNAENGCVQFIKFTKSINGF